MVREKEGLAVATDQNAAPTSNASGKREPTHWIGRLAGWMNATSAAISHDRLRGRVIWPGLALGLFTFIVALIFATITRIADLFLTTPASYVFPAIIGWIFCFGIWSTHASIRLPNLISPIIHEDDANAFDAYAQVWRRRLHGDIWSIVPSAALLIGLYCLLFFGASWWKGWAPSGWSMEPDKWAKLALLSWFFFWIAVLGYPMIWGFANYALFTYRVYTIRLVEELDIARTYLRPVTAFGVVNGFGWFFALAGVGYLFSRHFNPGAIVILAVFGLFGLWLLVAAQILMHLNLVRIQQHLIRQAGDLLLTLEPAGPQSDSTSIRERFERQLNVADQKSTWVYSPADALALAVQLVVPLATIALSAAFSH